MRALQSAVEFATAAAIADGLTEVEPVDTKTAPPPLDMRPSGPPPGEIKPLNESVQKYEREQALAAYEANGRNISAAAKQLKISRNKLYAILKEAGVHGGDSDDSE